MAKRFALILIAVLSVYVGFTIDRGLTFVEQDGYTEQILGVSIVLIGALGFYVIIKELQFGKTVAQMATQVDFAGKPTQGQSLSEAECTNLFESAREAVKASPNDWQSWFHLAIAYDINRDRRRAREAMRNSVRLYLGH